MSIYDIPAAMWSEEEDAWGPGTDEEEFGNDTSQLLEDMRLGRGQHTEMEAKVAMLLSLEALDREYRYAGLAGEVFAGIRSGVPDTIHSSIKTFRRLLSGEARTRTRPVRKAAIEAGLVPAFVQILARPCEICLPQQVEAIRVLGCLTEHGTSHSVEAAAQALPAAPALIRAISSPEIEAREQTLFVLSNIAGSATAARDEIISQGVLEPLISLLNGLLAPSDPWSRR